MAAFALSQQLSSAARAARAAPVRTRRAAVAVRASAEAPEETAAKAEATVYYTSKSGARVVGTMAEYTAAVASGDLYKASSVTGMGSASNQAVSLADAMAFAGPGPEKINGRLSMLAVVAALGAELSSHETVAKQLSEQPTLIVLAAVLVAAGSLVPLLEGKAVEQSKGFWNAAAEQTNGRAAMIGFASLLVTEKLAGHALL